MPKDECDARISEERRDQIISWIAWRPSLLEGFPDDPIYIYPDWVENWQRIVRGLKRDGLIGKSVRWDKVHIPCFAKEAKRRAGERAKGLAEGTL